MLDLQAILSFANEDNANFTTAMHIVDYPSKDMLDILPSAPLNGVTARGEAGYDTRYYGSECSAPPVHETRCHQGGASSLACASAEDQSLALGSSGVVAAAAAVHQFCHAFFDAPALASNLTVTSSCQGDKYADRQVCWIRASLAPPRC